MISGQIRKVKKAVNKAGQDALLRSAGKKKQGKYDCPSCSQSCPDGCKSGCVSGGK